MLKLSDVSRSFGSVHAVRGVNLTIPRGATFGLLGPNGAGKTTTMRMILGILIPDSGSVTWDGRPIDRAVRRRFGYLPEERGIYGKMKVRDQIEYFGRLHGLRDPDVGRRTAEWMEKLGISEYAKRPCSELSKGNQQKVQVACAVMHEPEFLIMDEPFSGLDPVNAEILLGVLRGLQQRGTALVLSSHQMWQIERLCTDFCIIASGEVRAAGTLEELRRNWPTRVIEVEPAGALLQAVIAAEPGARQRATSNGTLAFDIPRAADLPSLVRRLVAAGDITRFERLEPSLHDIYLRAIGETA
ncbi:MAG: ABC transporter ATP-binding protein [Candidatus Velthaea sp.]